MIKSTRWITAAAVLIGMFMGSVVCAAEKNENTPKKTAKDFVQKELLIKFKLGENQKGNDQIKKMGAKVLEKLSQIDISRLSLPKGLSVEKAIKLLSKLDFVEFVEPNFIQRTVGGPNDPRYKDQWGLEKIRAYQGWGIHTGRAKTIIAIVDTGVDLNHPDLKNRIIAGYNFVDDNSNPMDDEGHGTHCAGIAAASTNNNIGIAGVCPNCSIMPVRGLGADGQGTITTVANGIMFAADHGAHVISMSFGSPSYSTTLKNAIDYAAKKGAVLVAASGNDGVTTPFYPAYTEPVIAVGSSTEFQDQRSYFSNYGEWVDVAAPGSNILSTVPGGYSYKQGTSMAAPFVSGLAALMVSCSGASADKVRKAMLSSAKPAGDWVASGRIDVFSALQAVGCSAPGSSKAPSGTTPTAPDKSPPDGTPKSPSNDNASDKTPTDGNPSGNTPPPSNFGAVVSYKLVHGNMLKEPKDAAAASDDVRVGLSSKGSGMANYLDFTMTARMKTGVQYTALKVTVEAYSENAGNFEVQLKSGIDGQWVKAGTVRLESKDTTVSVEIGNNAKFVAENGDVQIRLYRTEKLWNGFEIGVDTVTVTGVEKAPESEKKEPEAGKSAGEKAKDTWNNLKKKF